jgi:hypothetical protein
MVFSTIISTSTGNISILKEHIYKNRDVHYPLLFERKIENVTAGLPPEYFNLLSKLPKDHALVIANYIESMKIEINLSDNYRKDVIKVLSRFLTFLYSSIKKSNKTAILLMEITKKELLAFLDKFRRSETVDPLHKWIGTYNTYRMHLMRFFKWLYYPDTGPDKRPKPEVIQNIPKLKRKEQCLMTFGLQKKIFYF